MKSLLATLLLAIVAACDASAPPPQSTTPPAEAATTLEVRDGWAAPTPGGVDVSAGYLTIVNGAGAADRLLSAASPRAARVEVHEMSMDGNVMQMRQIEALDIAAGQTVTLNQGAQHLMFFGVTEPFTQGESIPVTLTFEHAGDVDVTLSVRRGAPEHGH
jgi:hypothetical protein